MGKGAGSTNTPLYPCFGCGREMEQHHESDADADLILSCHACDARLTIDEYYEREDAAHEQADRERSRQADERDRIEQERVERLRRGEFEGVDPTRPPEGAWLRRESGGRVVIGGSTRRPVGSVLWLNVLTGLGLVLIGTVAVEWLGRAGLKPPGGASWITTKGSMPLPMATLTAAFWSAILGWGWWTHLLGRFGRVEAIVDHGRVRLWTGFGPVGFGRRLEVADIAGVGARVSHGRSTPDGFMTRRPGPGDRPRSWVATHGRIDLRSGKCVTFGGDLPEARRLFVIAALKAEVERGGRPTGARAVRGGEKR